MKTTTLFLIVLVAFATGCSESSVTKVTNALLGKEEIVEEVVFDYNIVLIADGTDLKHNQYAVPIMTKEYILQFVDKIQQKGKGRLWLGYIDSNSENNKIVYLEICQTPRSPETSSKKRSETEAEYNERAKKDAEQLEKKYSEFEEDKSKRLFSFTKEVQSILEVAYSDKVASAKIGSDVNGAINAGSRLLKTTPNSPTTKNYIALVSDGVDNVKRSLNEVPDNVEILLINSSGSKNRLEIGVVELDNLSRMEEYIFSKSSN